MLAQALDRGQQLEVRVVQLELDYPRPSLGNGARLVEHDRVDLGRALQGLASLDEHAQLGAPPGSHHDGRRRREPHGARTGNDEDGDG